MKLYFFVPLVFLTLNLAFSGCRMEQNKISPLQEGRTMHSVTRNQWQQVISGLYYRDISVTVSSEDQKPQSLDLLLVRVDPKQFIFSIYQNKDTKKTIREIHESTGSLLTLNGSFFDENFRPVGLLISMGKKLHHFSKAKLMNGIFAMEQNDKAKLYYPAHDISEEKSYFAVQNGPVLIKQNGQIAIHNENGAVASRTAIGLDKNENVIIIVAKQNLFNSENAITLYRFARLLKESRELKNLGLHSVLNLDGGSSTGIIINNRYLPELNPVQNVITVFKKHENNK